MKITAIQAFPLRASRDYVESTGLQTPKVAGQSDRALGAAQSPTEILSERALTAARTRHICSYPRGVQSLLIKVHTDAGITGIGESHAPVAPHVAKAIIEHVLAPSLLGEDPRAVDVLWEKMASAMRLRGHTTGFLTEAIAGVDIALWDIFGKSVGLPIYRLLGRRLRPAHQGLRVRRSRQDQAGTGQQCPALRRRTRLHRGEGLDRPEQPGVGRSRDGSPGGCLWAPTPTCSWTRTAPTPRRRPPRSVSSCRRSASTGSRTR